MNKRSDIITQLINEFGELQRIVFRHKEDYKTHDKHPIPFGQKAVFFIVATKQHAHVKDISQSLGITSGAVTQHVEALVQDGFLERTTDSDDRRNVIITLSKKGKKKFDQLQKERLDKLAGYFQDVSQEELESFIAVMNKVKQRIQQ